MRTNAWTPDEDAIIRAEIAAGARWIGRAVARLPGRTTAAIQVRASTLRLTAFRHRENATPAPRTAPVTVSSPRAPAPSPPEPASSSLVPEPKIPQFLADLAVFARGM